MKRSIAAICVWLAAGLASTAASAATVCTFSTGQLFVNCPCAQGTGRAQYLKCTNRKVSAMRRLGCDPGPLRRCATYSTCGLSADFIVCCDRHTRASVTTEERCTGSGGSVAVGATSICDASCSVSRPRPHTH